MFDASLLLMLITRFEMSACNFIDCITKADTFDKKACLFMTEYDYFSVF